MKLSLLIFLLTACICSVFAADKKCLVVGKIVDTRGNPVSKAGLMFYTPPTGWEDLIVGEYVDEEGRFSLEASCTNENLYLFAESPSNYESSVELVSQPLWNLRNSKKYPRLAGVKIPQRIRKKLGVGVITVPLKFKFKLKFEDANGRSLLPEKLDYSFWITVKTEDGDIIRSGSLNQLAYEKFIQNDALTVTLPEGKWIVEVNLNSDKGKTLYPDKFIESSDLETAENKTIVLKMSERKTLKVK